MEFPLAQVFWLVTSDLDGQSVEAAKRARDSVERTVARLRENCGSVPTSMVALRQRVRAATVAPLGARGLKALEDAFAKWVEATNAGTNHLEGAIARLRGCERLSDEIQAGYALWWDYSSNGRRWWVEMQVDNRTARGRLLELGGSISVTGLVDPRPDRFMPRDKERGGHLLSWGGSSADFMSARPFTTTSQRVALAAAEFVHTTSEGMVYSVRPEVFAFNGKYACSLPVPRLN